MVRNDECSLSGQPNTIAHCLKVLIAHHEACSGLGLEVLLFVNVKHPSLTAKDAKVTHMWFETSEDLKRGARFFGKVRFTHSVVDVYTALSRFFPKFFRQVSYNKGAHNYLSNGSPDTFNDTVMRRHVWTRCCRGYPKLVQKGLDLF